MYLFTKINNCDNCPTVDMSQSSVRSFESFNIEHLPIQGISKPDPQ